MGSCAANRMPYGWISVHDDVLRIRMFVVLPD